VSPLASVLAGARGERIALSDVSVSATLRDLLGEVTVCQTYRNDEDVNIEAVYTFPLPLDAVLLDLRVEIGGRTLKGVVVEKKAAEEEYEDAVAAGDAAVMLEAIEPGLYTMNVGNLLPKETAIIRFVYAIVYRWVRDTLRVSLPTTIAPRYGASPHAPHQTPESSLVVENQFSLQVEVFGSLREGHFVCPSHAVMLASFPERAVITLTQANAVMDRDFILMVKAPQATHSFAIYGTDGEGAAAIASFQPLFPGLRQPRPLDLAIVIDCSGSMQGDSIAHAKQALAGILDALESRDRVTVVAFGSTTKQLSDRLLPCTPANLGKARQFADELKADMGGTEIGPALQAAYAASGSESGDVFVVTDGEVSSWKAIVAEAKRSGRRVFTVGVGSAVSEAFVRGLAAATGGGCELVSPREGMADRVIRHFERMRAPRAKRVAIHWPEGARDSVPATFGAVFEGDTVTASAQFDCPSISGHVALEIETDGGDVFRQQLAMTPLRESADRVSTVARLAASARLKEMDRAAGLEQALRYRLVSPWTNWLVVAARSDGQKAFDIPALRKVPQTLAAGWGGMGAMAPRASADSMSALRGLSGREASAADGAVLERLSESLTPTMSGLSRLLAQADDVSRRLEPLAREARRAVESLEEHAQQTDRELRAIEEQVGALLSEIDTIQSSADVLRRTISEMESRAHHERAATKDALGTGRLGSRQREAIHQELLRRLADCEELLVQLKGLLAHVQERRMLLGHLHEVAREWAEVTMRYRHLAVGLQRKWR
jgi:Ca-activated chloride channel family protein